jgi:arylsulfatase A-like enzyme
VGFNPAPDQFRKQYTRRATQYIRRHNGENPFFMYLAYHMPHVPLGVSTPFRDTTGKGLYHDVIREIDWSVGQILQTLRKQGFAENTLVIFTSDNGPWLRYGPHAGSAQPLRGGKNSYFEGGVRVPTVAWWPGTISPGTTNEHPAMTIDLYPTFAELAGGTRPDYPIDGKNIFPMMTDPETSSPQEAYYFFGVNNVPGYNGLRGVRMGKWKLYFPHTFPVLPENPTWPPPGQAIPTDRDSIGLALFNL